MYTQDFIKRMINQVVAALQMIIGLKMSGQYGQALQTIDQALEQLTGFKADLVKQMDDRTILNSLTHDKGVDFERLSIIAELLKEEGDILATLKRPVESFSSHLRALNFLVQIGLSDELEELTSPNDKLLDLYHQLEKYQLPAHTLYGLFTYFEKCGRFALAARVLSRLADDPSLRDEVQQEFHEFYLRLLEKTDAKLEQGELPRSEIERRLAR